MDENPNHRNAGCAIIRKASDNTFLFMRPGAEYGNPEYIMSYGGMGDAGETGAQAVIRELKEEVALDKTLENYLRAVLTDDKAEIDRCFEAVMDHIEAEYMERMERADADGISDLQRCSQAKRQAIGSALIALENPTDMQRAEIQITLDTSALVHSIIDRHAPLFVNEDPIYVSNKQSLSEREIKMGFFQSVSSHYYDMPLSDTDFALFQASIAAKASIGLDYEAAGAAVFSASEMESMLYNPIKFKYQGTRIATFKILFPDQDIPTHPSFGAQAYAMARRAKPS